MTQPVAPDALVKELLRRVAELERQVAVMQGRIPPPPLVFTRPRTMDEGSPDGRP